MSSALTRRVGLASDAQRNEVLAALNTCFPGWGGPERFAWCFERPTTGRAPDVVTLVSPDGRALAGITLVYRSVRLDRTTAVVGAIIAGAWTLPEARGTGAFARLVREGHDVAVGTGADVSLGFVTAGNASRRGLARAGYDMHPAFYCRSATTHGSSASRLQVVAADSARPSPRPDARTSFTYSADEWRAQFLDRPDDVLRVHSDDGWSALIERVPGFDRVLTLDAAEAQRVDAFAALTAWATAGGRELFVYSTDAGEAEGLASAGFCVTEGFVGARVSDRMPTRSLHWHLEHGDRM